MPANLAPIYSKIGDIQGGRLITALSSDLLFYGTSSNTVEVFQADVTNGGFLQRLRFKAGNGNNAATVARVWINEGGSSILPAIPAPAGTPTGTPSATGGSLNSGTFFLKVIAYDQWGAPTIPSNESAAVNVATPYPPGTGSITWNWNFTTGTSIYRLLIGPRTNENVVWFTTTTNSFVQTVPYISSQFGGVSDWATNNIFYGEVSLPVTTAIATAATVEIDYPMNIALPPGHRILVGLAFAVTGGWIVSGIGGKY